MAVKKISVALEPDVAEAAASAAEAHGQSLSSWLNEAARNQLRVEQGLDAISAWQDEHGAFTDDERASAEALLDELLGRSTRRSA